MIDDETIGDPADAIMTPQGKPARKKGDDRCPRCGAGKEKRVASSGFGKAHPVCSNCGHEWHDVPWEGRT